MLKGKQQVVYVMLITAIFFYSCEKEVSSDMLVERNGLKYEINSEKPFSGKSVEYFDGGKVKINSKSYKDGKLDGIVTIWFENSQVSSEDSYKDGLSDGVYKLWSENGQQVAESSWKAGKANGMLKVWYENGQLKSEESYIDDERQGLIKVWAENGQQRFEGTFRDGQLDGKTREWYENGIKKAEGKFLNGQKDGPWTYWDQNGDEKIMMSDIDGNIYQTVQIGNQVWMAENLKVTHYRDGTVITNVTDNTAWGNLSTGAYCYYDNNSSNGDTYGALYNGYAVTNRHNIAPEGWHVPTDEEWQTLVDYLGGFGVAGGKMKETGTTHWDAPNTGATNESGFSALPGGYRRDYLGNYSYMGDYAYFYSYDALGGRLNYNDSEVNRGSTSKGFGSAVRCVKDQN